MIYLYFILVFIAGIVIGYLIANGKSRALTTRADMLSKQLSDAKEQHASEISSLKDEFNNQTLKQIELMKEQLSTASEKELRSRTEDLSKFNRDQLDKILIPLNENIGKMIKQSEETRQYQTETNASLRQFVETTRQETQTLGKTTNNLVNALSHDNKYQGGFGEMQLRQLLENFGFQNGVHFEEQVTIRDKAGNAIRHEQTGRRMQPDVVLYFPDNRDIIIDAKTSMTAFMRYTDSSLTEVEHQQALNDHLTAIRTQVKDLSSKNYQEYYNKNGVKLEFVVMFVPSEAAMQLAVSKDPSLWSEAFEKGVFITGPQNLYALLQLLDVSWKRHDQLEYQQHIIESAKDIVARVQLFRERYEQIRNNLSKIITDGFKGLDVILSDEGKSIITSAQNLIKCGIKEDKKRKSLKDYNEALLLEDDSLEEEEKDF